MSVKKEREAGEGRHAQHLGAEPDARNPRSPPGINPELAGRSPRRRGVVSIREIDFDEELQAEFARVMD